ncbi:MAG TPA: endonuclease/exonuclease/phosphatase family protein [Kineosporiaceae bacterium]|nr:endonuclease/exonuclease/phosphatase family protein [Kineosporiaceae bacterium]
MHDGGGPPVNLFEPGPLTAEISASDGQARATSGADGHRPAHPGTHPGTDTDRDPDHDPDHDPGSSGPRAAGRRVKAGEQVHGARKALHLLGLPVAATLLLVWSMTTLIGNVRWGPLSVLPVGLASISPLVVLVALPLITLSLKQRRSLPVVPAVAAALLPWGFVLGYASPAPEPSGTTLPLRAMIVTAHDGSADARGIAQAVADQKVDLLVVTELSGPLAHDLTVAGVTNRLTARWVMLPEPGQSPAAGIGVYSRFPIDGFTPLNDTKWPAVRATVTVEKAHFTLIAGHAVQPSVAGLDSWRRDLAAFGSAAKIKGPVVVLVNLNATVWHAQFRHLVAGRLHDAGDVLGRGLRPTWPSWALPLLPTDHALVAGGVGVAALDTTGVQGSDHRALTVALEVPYR